MIHILTSRFAGASLAVCTMFCSWSIVSADSLTEAERQAIVAELQPLQERLNALRKSPQVPQDRWADAQIFVKGVIWALDFGPVNDAKARELVQKGLRRARERTEQLTSGQQPWTEKRGTTIRGFISNVDGSVQPYGLVVPAGYDPAKPTRLDVVLHGSRSATGFEKAFAKEGVPFVGLVDRGAGHGITPGVYQEQLRLLGEHAAKGIDPFPKHVRFVTWTLKFSHCHWLEVLGLEAHYQRADIEATVDTNGTISIPEPRNITRFALHPPAVSATGGDVTVGQTKLTLPPQPEDKLQSVVIEKRNGAYLRVLRRTMAASGGSIAIMIPVIFTITGRAEVENLPAPST